MEDPVEKQRRMIRAARAIVEHLPGDRNDRTLAFLYLAVRSALASGVSARMFIEISSEMFTTEMDRREIE